MVDLTPERLAELRALAAAASPGPWFFDYCRVDSSPKTKVYDEIDLPECEVPAWKTSCTDPPGTCHGCPSFELDYEANPIVAFVPPHHGDTATGQRAADARYIAAAHPDVVTALVAEVERLRAVLMVGNRMMGSMAGPGDPANKVLWESFELMLADLTNDGTLAGQAEATSEEERS